MSVFSALVRPIEDLDTSSVTTMMTRFRDRSLTLRLMTLTHAPLIGSPRCSKLLAWSLEAMLHPGTMYRICLRVRERRRGAMYIICLRVLEAGSVPEKFCLCR